MHYPPSLNKEDMGYLTSDGFAMLAMTDCCRKIDKINKGKSDRQNNDKQNQKSLTGEYKFSNYVNAYQH